MAEEDQVTQPEETEKAEQAPTAESGETAASTKRKKINRLSLDMVTRKIDEMEKADQIHSKYYQHLIDRKNEMQVQ